MKSLLIGILLLSVSQAHAGFVTGYVVGSSSCSSSTKHVPSDQSACLVNLHSRNQYSGEDKGEVAVNSHHVTQLRTRFVDVCDERGFLSCKRSHQLKLTAVDLVNDDVVYVSESLTEVEALLEKQCKGK